MFEYDGGNCLNYKWQSLHFVFVEANILSEDANRSVALSIAGHGVFRSMYRTFKTAHEKCYYNFHFIRFVYHMFTPLILHYFDIYIVNDNLSPRLEHHAFVYTINRAIDIID